MASDPPGRSGDSISPWIRYITADGFGPGAIKARMERLKFETIVQEKTIAEVLADQEPER